MAGDPPVVYLLHGPDEFGISGFLSELAGKFGDATTAALNTTRLEGNAFSVEELRMAAMAMPFLAPRRLVVVTSPQSRLTTPDLQRKFITLLDELPATAAVVLVEYRTLPENDWLLAWALRAGARTFIRQFTLLSDGDMARWLGEQARNAGCEITPEAAWSLVRMVGLNARMAFHELQKLQAYVNFTRTIDVDDVEALGIPVFHERIFALVDALAKQDAKNASRLLRQFLDEEAPQYIMSMIARQIRLLLLARDVLDQGGSDRELQSGARLKAFEARKVMEQARRFTQEKLDSLYRKLLEMDTAIKSGLIEDEVALDSLVASITLQ